MEKARKKYSTSLKTKKEARKIVHQLIMASDLEEWDIGNADFDKAGRHWEFKHQNHQQRQWHGQQHKQRPYPSVMLLLGAIKTPIACVTSPFVLFSRPLLMRYSCLAQSLQLTLASPR
eukprot:GHVT01061996.1.p3 GENE.GHVT01061996.1~~GHVT01061996.1.p3  ORF type:complete len:118 (+),score=12.66 GHVT01061996.1:1054-1407(+)